MKKSTQFVKEGNVSKTPDRNKYKLTLLDGCTDRRVISDIDRKLAFPTEITSTHQRPDLVIWSVNSKKVIIAELTILFEVNIDWAHQWKSGKFEDLRKQCIKNDRSIDIFPLEIGCRGFISNSISTFLTKIGLSPAKKREYIKKIQNKTITASEWIWYSYRLNSIQKGLVVLWDTAGAPCVRGNDASVPKPCLNRVSSSDEEFIGSKTDF